MKIKDIIFLLILVFLITGCVSNKFNDNYKNMEIKDGKLDGYNMDIRIYGIADDKRINEIVRVTNYKDTEYKIDIISNTIDMSNNNIEDDLNKEEKTITEPQSNKSTIYVKDKKIYTSNKDNTYSKVDSANYTKTYLYLDSLKKINKVKETKEEKIGENKYKVSKVIFDKDIINQILKDIPINLTIDSDINGEIYIDSKEYVYRIIYNIEDLTINVNYFGINIVNPINFPSEIE